jgi:hydrogenase-4 component E
MTASAYAELVDLAAGALVLCAVLIVWRRELVSMVRVLAVQGLALAVLPFAAGLRDGQLELLAIAGVVVAVRVVALPALLRRAIDAQSGDERESTPLVNTAATLLAAAALTVAAFAIARPIVALEPGPTTRAVPAALAVVLIAMLVLVTRRRALSQAVGFLLLDNGIAATAFLITAGVPLLVEIGASLDILFAVLIIGVLTGRMRQAFGTTDLDRLQELHE